jgi:aspartyl protease family protein
MGRLFLLIITIGVLIGAMLPSPPANEGRAPSITEPKTEIDFVDRHIRVSDRRSAPLEASVVSGQGTTLSRESDGHFYADAQVNGTTVHFLVDTGASGVALSVADARRVGLPFFSSEFTSVGRGASGDVRGKMVMLDRVTLGGKSVDNVGGAILEGGEMSLLGQSFLSRMGTIEMTSDQMVIR